MKTVQLDAGHKNNLYSVQKINIQLQYYCTYIVVIHGLQLLFITTFSTTLFSILRNKKAQDTEESWQKVTLHAQIYIKLLILSCIISKTTFKGSNDTANYCTVAALLYIHIIVIPRTRGQQCQPTLPNMIQVSHSIYRIFV